MQGAHLVSDICGLVCVLTHLAENACRVGCSEVDRRMRSFVFVLGNAAVESSCHCTVYFYVKSSQGFLYIVALFSAVELLLFHNYS